MYRARDIANYFLSMADEDAGEAITNLKVQKLLYYAQGFHLALFGEPLFGEPIEAWLHGPVVPDVYHEFKAHGAGSIPAPGEDFDYEAIDPEIRQLLDDIYATYGQFSAWKLRDMTHEEPPWKDTPQNTVIPHEALTTYFRTQLDD